MSLLVTLTTAKNHLRITTDDQDSDISLKLDQAEGIILEYLDTSADPLWVSPETAPESVTAAILLALGDLREHLGDEPVSAATWESIARLLVRKRNPALA